jgi:GWxTD domain-containing protein
MPAGLLAGLTPAQIEAILLHELAHVRRHDYLVNLAQRAVEALLFYHPAVWWVSRVIRIEREHCCDDTVIAVNRDPRTYAETLAALETMRAIEPALAATGAPLAARVRRLLRSPESDRLAGAPLLASLLLVCAGAVALPAWQSPAPDPAPQEIGSPYRRWLNEDVAYIITDAERQAFKNLRTNEEYERFIQQFWERRDPTLGTAENEFKEEHYRRIAYTNEKFAATASADSAGLPGWKTDRGRIYIVYGPSDEKETHAGNASTPPYEDWLYRHIVDLGPVVVRFVDENRDGRYRQATMPLLALPPVRAGGGR